MPKKNTWKKWIFEPILCISNQVEEVHFNNKITNNAVSFLKKHSNISTKKNIRNDDNKRKKENTAECSVHAHAQHNISTADFNI